MTTPYEQMLAQMGLLHDDMAQLPAEIRTTMDGKAAEVNEFLDGAARAIGAPSMLAFDPTVLHSKSSLFSNGMTVDPANVGQSRWFRMDGNTRPAQAHLYRSGNGRAFVLHSRNWQTNGAGAGNNPPYSSDYSQTLCDFVLASHYGTSGEINQWFIDNPNAVSPLAASHNGNTAFSSETPIASIPGEHPYLSLFVRFRNVVGGPAIAAGQATEQSPLQNVQTYGGNPFFGLHAVTHHPF